MNPTKLISALIGGVLVAGGLSLGIGWSLFRVYVPSDKCLVLIRKTGDALPPGETIAGPGQKGIQRETLGPGRYFLNPWVWNWELRDLVTIDAGDPASWHEYYAEAATDTSFPEIKGSWPKVGILVNKIGKAAPEGVEVVDEGFKGIQKHVLTPGMYRINPHIYEVRTVNATVVPLGCCGVVTSQLGDAPGVQSITEDIIDSDGHPSGKRERVVQKLAAPGQRGVLEQVLQPGIYYLNPYVHKVQIVQVGYNQMTQVARRYRTAQGDEGFTNTAQPPDQKASPKARQFDSQNLTPQQAEKLSPQEISTHITFPAKDGYTIDIEVTVVWGRHPAHVAEMINRFGDLEKLKQIILSQMRSICRNVGSEYESTDFIRGEKRELYQHAVTDTLRRVCRERDVEILIALINNIAVRGGAEGKDQLDLKATIQRGFIAKEQDITKTAQKASAEVKATLETAKANVGIAREKIASDTRKKVAELKAEAQKKAQEIDAQRGLEVATIEREIAELDAQKTLRLGQATAKVEQLKNQAQAEGKRMMVEAFGTGRAYNLYTFAENFAPDSIRLIFAGEGTFWTDLTSLQDAAAMELLKKSAATEPPLKAPTPDKPKKPAPVNKSD